MTRVFNYVYLKGATSYILNVFFFFKLGLRIKLIDCRYIFTYDHYINRHKWSNQKLLSMSLPDTRCITTRFWNGNNHRNNIENIVQICLFRQLFISQLIVFISFYRRLNVNVLSKNISCTSWPVNPPDAGTVYFVCKCLIRTLILAYLRCKLQLFPVVINIMQQKLFVES